MDHQNPDGFFFIAASSSSKVSDDSEVNLSAKVWRSSLCLIIRPVNTPDSWAFSMRIRPLNGSPSGRPPQYAPSSAPDSDQLIDGYVRVTSIFGTSIAGMSGLRVALSFSSSSKPGLLIQVNSAPISCLPGSIFCALASNRPNWGVQPS